MDHCLNHHSVPVIGKCRTDPTLGGCLRCKLGKKRKDKRKEGRKGERKNKVQNVLNVFIPKKSRTMYYRGREKSNEILGRIYC